MNTQGAYVGIDISSKSTVLSIYKSNMDEPATISTIIGEENYSIPTVIAKRFGMGQWFFGEDALKMSRLKEAVLVEELYNLALRDGQVVIEAENYSARDLMVIFFNLSQFLKAYLPIYLQCSFIRLQWLKYSFHYT